MPIAITPDQLALQASIRDWAICLARTDPDRKHQGITYFLLDAAERVLGLPR